MIDDAKIVNADETTKHILDKRRRFVTNETIGTGIFIIFAAVYRLAQGGLAQVSAAVLLQTKRAWSR